MITRKTSLSANIVSFCRFLRQKGFTIGPAEETDALLALEKLASFQQPESGLPGVFNVTKVNITIIVCANDSPPKKGL